jgi:hypothetical protein
MGSIIVKMKFLLAPSEDLDSSLRFWFWFISSWGVQTSGTNLNAVLFIAPALMKVAIKS